MIDNLHRSVWFTYRRAIGADASWDAAAAFQVALDLYLSERPGSDAALACQEAARMIMTRPRGVANRGRIVANAGAQEAASRDMSRRAAFGALARFSPVRIGRR